MTADADSEPQDILAVVSKAIFDRVMAQENLSEGSVWPTKSYASANKGLAPLAKGGRLFLVTVRPPNEALWLVAILEKAKFDGKQWLARANVTPICDVSNLRSEIRFTSGSGMPTKVGVLGMSLQTPRVLTARDAALLAAAKPSKSGSARAKKSVAATTPTKKKMSKRELVDLFGAAPPRTSKKKKTKRSSTKVVVVPEVPTLDQETLLTRWRKTRSTQIADVLQCVVVDAAWKARLSSIAKGGTSRAVRDRLFKLPDDPRVTVFLIECLRKARWPGSSARTLWTLIFKRLVSLADARAIAPLREAAATPPYFLGAGHTAWIVSQITATADALEKIARKQKPDDAATLALVAEQPVTPPAAGWFASAKPAGETLLRDVWAAPDDDAVRAVAADALLEQNDAWGELISLQLSGGTGKHREQIEKLVRKHASRFAGPIAKVAASRSLKFERGFLASCVIGKDMIGRRLWEEALRAPHWATVHTVQFELYNQPPRWWLTTFYATASLASLRTIKIGSVVLSRESQSGAWKVTSAPERVDGRVATTLESIVKSMPVSERARIPTPASKGVRALLEGRASADWDP